MTIASAITNAQNKVANAYSAVSTKGGTLPATQNLSNLPTAIGSIPTGITPTGTINISANGTYNVTNYATAHVKVRPSIEIYEFIIDTSQSDPDLAVSYTGNNSNFTPASMNFSTGVLDYGSWGNAFFQPRPVMIKSDGTVDYELYKNNFELKADGITASDVSNTAYDGNCMIGFPQVWMKFVEDDTTHQHIYISNIQIDSDYHCYTHYNKNGELLDEIYIMAYEPSNISNKLRSLSGQQIIYDISGETMQTYAQANGASWDFMDLGEWIMLQMLFILMFKSINSQNCGSGVIGGTAYERTGSTKNKGMFYSIDNTTFAVTPIKVFGIENLWGNRFKWLNGLVVDTSGNLKYKLCDYTTDGSTVNAYSQSGVGYNTLATVNSPISGVLKKMYLNTKGMFLYPNSNYITGSNYGLYYCDYAAIKPATNYNRYARVGGAYVNSYYAGLFCCDINEQLSTNTIYYGASLSCKPILNSN